MCDLESTTLFTSRKVGTTGYEILYGGKVVAWAINEGTADLIVDCHNMTVAVIEDDEEENR